MTLSPSESYSITMRLEIQNKVGMLGKVTTAIGTAGGTSGRSTSPATGRNGDPGHHRAGPGDRARAGDHQHHEADPGGQGRERLGPDLPDAPRRKIEVHNKIPVKTRNDLSMAYTRASRASAWRSTRT